jgi:hypothetical protein
LKLDSVFRAFAAKPRKTPASTMLRTMNSLAMGLMLLVGGTRGLRCAGVAPG